MVGDIYVDEGNSSYIVPGTKFLFDGPYSFTINGSITVDGALGDSVYFINKDPNVSDGNKWLGILIDGAPSSSSINYARVSGVYDNDDMPDVNIDGYAIKVQYSNLSLSNLLVTQNSRGVHLYTANPTIDNLHSMYNNNTIRIYDDGYA